MAGGEILHLRGWKSAFIEFFFKPAIFSAAVFASAWLRWASPPKCYPYTELITASNKAVFTVWGKNPVMSYKMNMYVFPLAALCEADNAYAIWFFEFCREMAKYAPERKNKR
jgi:hypothetical protein